VPGATTRDRLPASVTATAPTGDPVEEPTHRIRVLLVDDHAVVRMGLRAFFDLQDDIEVVGEASDGSEGVAMARRLEPEVILFDEPNVRGIIRALKPDVHVKGTDYTPDSIPEADEVRAYGGRTAVAGDPKNHSTTEIARRTGREGGKG